MKALFTNAPFTLDKSKRRITMGFFDKLLKDVSNALKTTPESNAQTSAKPVETPAPAVEPAVPAGPQQKEIPYGAKNPFPYDTEMCGTPLTVYLRFFGKFKVTAVNAATVNGFGGLDALTDKLISETVTLFENYLHRLSANSVPCSRLPMYSQEIQLSISSELEKTWPDKYGVSLDSFSVASIAYTEESKKKISELQKKEMEEMLKKSSAPAENSNWTCPNCKTENTGKFCSNCGKSRE